MVGSDIPGCGHVLLVVRLNCDLNFYGKVGTFINVSKYVCIEHQQRKDGITNRRI